MNRTDPTYRIPTDHRGAMTREPLTRTEVEASPYITKRVREYGRIIRAELAANGACWFFANGDHKNNGHLRDFAFRVLVAKGECIQDPNDARRYIAC